MRCLLRGIFQVPTSFYDLPRGLPETDADTGSAARETWMAQETLAQSEKWQFSPDKIFFGATEAGDKLGFKDDRHIVTVAGSRAGKGRAAILPNLALYEGSVMVLDPKGENASETAERRGKGRNIRDGGLGQEVYVLDPFKVADVPAEYLSGFNPLTGLNPENDDFIDECGSIADALVPEPPNNNNPHFTSTARLVLRGFIAWVAATAPDEKRNIITVRDLLALPYTLAKEQEGISMLDLLDKMATNDDVADGLPASVAHFMRSLGDDERGSVLSTVRDNIAFLSSRPIKELLSGNQRAPDLNAWKFGGVSIYLCLPAGRLHLHGRFFRLFIDRLLTAVESTTEKNETTPALMILDEMHVLGHMARLETAAGLLASFGIKFWSIWQDFAQLKSIYKDRWETFLGNASIFQSFGLNDVTTLEYVSKRLGSSTIVEVSQGEQSIGQAAHGFSGQTRSVRSQPLLTLEEVAFHFSRQSENQLLIYAGVAPIHIKRVPFHDDYFKNVRLPDD